MMRVQQAILLTTLLAAMAACSPKPLIVGQVADLVGNGAVAFERDDDLELVEQALPANIKLLEAMLVSDPNNGQLRTLLARLYGSYAFGFPETRLEEILFTTQPTGILGTQMQILKARVNRCYEKGIGYALAALELSKPGAADAFAKIGTVESYLSQMEPPQVPALFWYGFNLGAWVNRNLDSVRAVSRAHVARAVMERTLQLDPHYHHAGAHLFLMTYFGSRSPMTGGSQEAATDHFLKVKRLVGDDYLLPDLMYARYCLPQQQNREAFVDALQRIVNQPIAENDTALYNAVARRRAMIYLSGMDRLFE